MPESLAAIEPPTDIAPLPSAAEAADPSGRLTSFQLEVLTMISLGQTVTQTARKLEAAAETVGQARQNLCQALGTRSLAAAVSAGIQEACLAVEVNPDHHTTLELSSFDTSMLYFYAAGGNNRQVAEQHSLSLKAINLYQQHLLKKVGAWSIPHAVRRAYELGIITRAQSAPIKEERNGRKLIYQ